MFQCCFWYSESFQRTIQIKAPPNPQTLYVWIHRTTTPPPTALFNMYLCVSALAVFQQPDNYNFEAIPLRTRVPSTVNYRVKLMWFLFARASYPKTIMLLRMSNLESYAFRFTPFYVPSPSMLRHIAQPGENSPKRY